MKLHLELKNFQSISNAKLEFETGINVISGSNSSGKTGILRALYALMTNPSHAKRYIKHGETEAIVKLSLPDYNHDIEWYRKESGVKYIINGEENNKCGRNTLFDFVDDFPFTYEQSTGKVINIQTEHDPLFPFQRSATDLFKLFEDIFQISDSSTILASIKKDEQDTKKTHDNTKLKIKDIEDKLQHLTEFNSNYLYQDVQQMKDKCTDLITEYIYVSKGYKECLELNQSIDILNNDLPPIEDFDLSIINNFIIIDSDYQKVLDLDKYIKFTLPDSQMFDISNLIIDMDTMARDLKLCQELQVYEDQELIPVQNFDMSIFNDVIVFEKSYKDIQNLVTQIKFLTTQTDTLDIEINIINEQLSQVTNCPLCGNQTLSYHTH